MYVLTVPVESCLDGGIKSALIITLNRGTFDKSQRLTEEIPRFIFGLRMLKQIFLVLNSNQLFIQ